MPVVLESQRRGGISVKNIIFAMMMMLLVMLLAERGDEIIIMWILRC